MDLAEFLRSELRSPASVLEVGCGEGALARALAAAGHDVLAIDPDAPEGPLFRRVTLEELDETRTFDVVVAERVLHHVRPLAPALDKLVRLAPLLVLDEFSWELIDPVTQAWYEALYRRLLEGGQEPAGPPDLGRWRADHPDLQRSDVLLEAVAERYKQRHFERRPYFYRWLQLPELEAAERAAIDAGVIRPIGFRYLGARSRADSIPPCTQ